MNDTKNPTALQSQKWILQSLLRLMENTDYDKISVSEICRMAELDRRTFYRNFTSKNDVLEQYIKEISDKYMKGFQNVNSKDRYEATMFFFEFWKDHIPFILNIQNCGLSNFVFLRFEKFVKSNQVLLIDRKAPDARIDYMFTYRIGGFWNVMLAWAANNADMTPAELTDIILGSSHHSR